MSTNNSLTRRELLGAFVYFIPSGTVVDGVTTSITSWPDNSPTTNYSDWQFQDVETVVHEQTKNTETIKVPSTAGGYVEDEEIDLTKNAYVCTTHKTNSVLEQLQNGLLAAAAIGVPQKPMGSRQGYIEGVLLVEFMGKTQTVQRRTQVWARLSIDTPSGAQDTTNMITFRFTWKDADLNTQENYA